MFFCDQKPFISLRRVC